MRPARRPVKVDIVLTSGPPDVRRLAAELRDAGADGVASVEGPHDVFVPLVQAAAVDDLDIASYVAIAFPRSPVHLAHTAWDLQALSGGRFRLGLGTQVRAHVERRYGSDFDHPVERMREWVEAIRAVFDCWQHGSELAYTGRFTTHTMMPPMLAPRPLDHRPPPILVGALGPRLLAMTLEVADGVVLHPMTTEPFLADLVDVRIPAGLAAATRADARVRGRGGCAGRGSTATTIADAVRGTLRGLVAFYGSTPAYRPVLDSIGAGDLQPELRQLTQTGRWGDLASVVDDGVLDQLTVTGDAETVAARLRHLYAGRVDRLSVTLVQPLPPPDLGAMLDRLRD